MSNRDTIFFFGPRQRHGFLSNFYISPFTVDGVSYNCVEQWMHSEKARIMGDERVMREIRMTETPKEQKRLGRQVRQFDGKKWNKVREEVVYRGLLAKFSQNEHLRKLLLDTGDSYLAEVNPWDKIWGIGDIRTPQEDWGLNLLGKLLMKVRSELNGRN